MFIQLTNYYTDKKIIIRKKIIQAVFDVNEDFREAKVAIQVEGDNDFWFIKESVEEVGKKLNDN